MKLDLKIKFRKEPTKILIAIKKKNSFWGKKIKGKKRKKRKPKKKKRGKKIYDLGIRSSLGKEGTTK